MSLRTAGLVVVVPAFNEARTVRDVVRRALHYADRVIVVDDGSTDGTAGRLTGLAVPVIRHSKNLGKAAALHEGIRWGMRRGTAIVTMDADGQHHPEDIPALREAFDREPDAIVIGARVRGAAAIPLSRRVGHATARFWITLASGTSVGDSQSGFRLYPASILERLEARCNWTSGFAVESELLIEAGRLGVPIREIPIDAVYHDRLRRSHYRQLRDTWTITCMVTRKILMPRTTPSGFPPVEGNRREDHDAPRLGPRSCT